MAILSKEKWLSGSDLTEETVEVPELGGEVKIRSLPAAYSAQASSEAMELKSQGRDQVATVNTAVLEVLQFQHGVIEPTFSKEEVEQIATQYAGAWRTVIDAIDRISAVNKEALANAEARFPAGRGSENGSDVENATPDGGS